MYGSVSNVILSFDIVAYLTAILLQSTKSAKEVIKMTEGFTIKEYERAEAELRTRKRYANFYSHAALYVLVNVVLIVINVAFMPAYPWCLIPLVLWGVCLLAHYFEAYVWISDDIKTWEAKVEYRAGEIHSGNMA